MHNSCIAEFVCLMSANMNFPHPISILFHILLLCISHADMVDYPQFSPTGFVLWQLKPAVTKKNYF